MAHTLFTVEDINYTVSLDDPAPNGARFWAILMARAVDELDNQPVETILDAESDLGNTASRVAADGLVGIVGAPRQAWQELAAHGYAVQLTIRAGGYVPRRVSVVIPNDQRALAAPAPGMNDTVLTLTDSTRLGAGESLLVGPTGPNMAAVRIVGLGPGPNQVTFFPPLRVGYAVGDPVVPVVSTNFGPMDLGSVMLRRQPVSIQGTTNLAVGNTLTPVPFAQVQVTGIWRVAPLANMAVPSSPPDLVSLNPPLLFDRDTLTAQVVRCVLSPILGEDKQLVAQSLSGAQTFRVSNRRNLLLGQTVLIDALDPDTREYVTLTNIAGSSDVDQPADLTTSHPLARDHRPNAIVRRVTVIGLGAPTGLSAGAAAGDTCILPAALGVLLPPQQVRVSGGGPPPEYHDVRTFDVQSNASGLYRFPPLQRVAQLELTATTGGHPPVKFIYRPDYGTGTNRVDFTFR